MLTSMITSAKVRLKVNSRSRAKVGRGMTIITTIRMTARAMDMSLYL